MDINNNIERIIELKKKKNAIILAHYYQRAEIQEIADFIGDSYALSVEAKKTSAKIIVFAGVKFMAETAKIINPDAKVLLPDLNAGCSLADSCNYDDFKKFIEKHKNAVVVTYINSSVEIKALSDIICTSSNAIKIVNSIPKDKEIIFAPDKNLGNYVKRVTGRDLIIWNGVCHVHNQIHIDRVLKMKELHPEALLLAHPECQGVILEIADFIGSTSQMIEYASKSDKEEFIIATETGITHQLSKNSPNKKFYVVPADESCACNDCNYMKMITIDKILESLEEEKYEIIIEEEVRKRAEIPIKRMIEIVSK